ncbi:MAG: class I SAM-dependent methyltransferase [Defluviitaleaceae bacterium]|nr:class I SAM-dependent methyltransferase [Defluviitaleaceae bacterium]
MKGMNTTMKMVKAFYDDHTEEEWTRLDRRPIEFEIAKRFLARFIKPGDKVLDMGGGPGRYAIWLAKMGCKVTLADLSSKNVGFVKKKSKELGLSIRALQLDARYPDGLKGEKFDHVLLFGPLYHLLEEKDRKRAVQANLALLKPGGTLSCTFISSYTIMLYYLKNAPNQILEDSEFMKKSIQQFTSDEPFCGLSFTQVYYTKRKEALAFMSGFPLEKQHFLGMEGMLAPFEKMTNEQPEEVVNTWIDIAEQVCEREDLMSWAEHFLYIGKKM